MGTHPTFSPSTGPAAAYQPKTTDESDASVAGAVVPHVNVQGALLGVAADAAVPDITANGAAFTFISLFKGMVANGFTLLSRLPSSIGQKVATNSLSVVLASNSDPVPTTQTADQDPIFDHTNGTKFSVTASATVLTPPAGCKYARISTDVDIFVNTAGIATVVDDGTAIRILANSPEVIPVVAGVAVKALSSTGTAVVRVTPLKVR